jgi:hypothetical protein
MERRITVLARASNNLSHPTNDVKSDDKCSRIPVKPKYSKTTAIKTYYSPVHIRNRFNSRNVIKAAVNF